MLESPRRSVSPKKTVVASPKKMVVESPKNKPAVESPLARRSVSPKKAVPHTPKGEKNKLAAKTPKTLGKTPKVGEFRLVVTNWHILVHMQSTFYSV